MSKANNTTTQAERKAEDARALEFLALLLSVPADEREEVLAKLRAVSAPATR